jgi:hypothetical protein
MTTVATTQKKLSSSSAQTTASFGKKTMRKPLHDQNLAQAVLPSALREVLAWTLRGLAIEQRCLMSAAC